MKKKVLNEDQLAAVQYLCERHTNGEKYLNDFQRAMNTAVLNAFEAGCRWKEKQLNGKNDSDKKQKEENN